MGDSNVNISVNASTSQAVNEIKKINGAFKGVQDSMKQTTSKMYTFSQGIKNVGKNIYSVGQRATAGISIPLGTAQLTMINTGAEMKALGNTFKVVFGDMTDNAKSWSTSLGKSVGLDSGIIDKVQLNFAKMGAAYGYTGKDLMDFTQKFTKMTLDLAAFNDIPIDDATERMMSGLRGEADAVEKLGVFMGATNLQAEMLSEGIKGQYSDLDNATKSTVLYNLAMKQTKKAYGQAARESSSYQNSLANVKQSFAEMSEQYFKAVEPALLGFLDKVTEVLDKMKELTPEQWKAISQFAIWATVIPPLIMYLGAFIESVGRIGEVISFLIRLNPVKIFMGIKSALETAYIYALYFADGLAVVGGWITTAFSAIGTAFTALATAIGISVGWLIAIIVGIVVVVFLVIKYWDQIKAWTIKAWASICDWLAQAWDWIKKTASSVWGSVVQSFTDCWTAVLGVYNTYIKPVVDAIVSVFSYLWNDILQPIFQYSGGFFKALGELILWVAQKLILIAINYIVNKFNYWMGIAKFVLNAIGDAFKWLGTQFQNIYNTYLKPVIQFFVDQFNKAKASISSIINGIQAIWKGFCTIIKTYWNIYGKPIMDAMKSVWDGIKTAWSNGINSIKSKFSDMVDGLKSLWNNFKSMFKLPHVAISGSWDLTPPSISVPTMSVNWYETGGIFTGASVIGVGENGDEAVVPLNNKNRVAPFANAVAGQFMSLLPDVLNNSKSGNGDVVITGNSFVVREEADIQKVAKELYKLQERGRRGKGRVSYGNI